MAKNAVQKFRELLDIFGFKVKNEYIMEKLDSDADSEIQEQVIMQYNLVTNMNKGQLIENLGNLSKAFDKSRECKGYAFKMGMNESTQYVKGEEFSVWLHKKAK